MKIGDRIQITSLCGDDLSSTDLKVGATGLIEQVGTRAGSEDHPLDIFKVSLDEDYQTLHGNVNVRWLFRKQLEVIEEAP